MDTKMISPVAKYCGSTPVTKRSFNEKVVSGLAYNLNKDIKMDEPELDTLKLNVGCGNKLKEDHVNIDIRQLNNPDILIADIRNLPYESETVDEIYANDVLEHVSFRETLPVLEHWFKILKPGGKLFIQSPHFGSLVNLAVKAKTIPEKLGAIARFYGGQDYPENTHMNAIDEDILQDQLKVAGFTTTMRWEAGTFGNNTNIRATIFKQKE